MRGLHKATGGWNSAAARNDWRIILILAKQRGLTPPEVDFESLGWRRLDKIASEYMAETGITRGEIDAYREAFCPDAA